MEKFTVGQIMNGFGGWVDTQEMGYENGKIVYHFKNTSTEQKAEIFFPDHEDALVYENYTATDAVSYKIA